MKVLLYKRISANKYRKNELLKTAILKSNEIMQVVNKLQWMFNPLGKVVMEKFIMGITVMLQKPSLSTTSSWKTLQYVSTDMIQEETDNTTYIFSNYYS